jgi:hypothetical protein
LTLGFGFYFQALNFMEYRKLSNVVLIIFGGLAPAILAVRVKFWMVFTCTKPQFLPDLPVTKNSFMWDCLSLAIALVGFALIVSTFS